MISIIAVLGRNREIGGGGKLLWYVPGDQQYFREITMGHPVIMGRKTWESIPQRFRPLPGRTNIVVTREVAYHAPGATLAGSLVAALALAEGHPGAEEIFVIGGGEIYAAALPYANRLYLTQVDAASKGADTFFPAYEDAFTLKQRRQGEGSLRPLFEMLERRA